ncbi:uncharacterized protein OCT59_022881 [Rhizophagus irregularis]|uniref:Uncharacterized protein n=2 Tax=Rhizophagus irregularis TaxID=588596 RepID=A0A2N1N4H6_9GLOM|nr:hypothetical protein RirG_267320 [Rhizophagus irregularis DAOM 197198w]PKK68787.1 hypothetical protein RhiirC2_749593 [Rhizophagus irregularis]UZO29404.1 hypothetical protein OCT59_022881 [Rhizophagus irregularis]
MRSYHSKLSLSSQITFSKLTLSTLDIAGLWPKEYFIASFWVTILTMFFRLLLVNLPVSSKYPEIFGKFEGVTEGMNILEEKSNTEIDIEQELGGSKFVYESIADFF